MENTDAASVELMTAPIRKLSKRAIRSASQQKSPTSPAVSTVPSDDSSPAFSATGRASRHLVPKPP